MGKGRFFIGTSGYSYNHWEGRFYPGGLPKKQWLPYYAERLQSVEINNTFYRLPEKSTFLNWYQSVPEEFLFALKASRYLTHIKKLKDPKDPVSLFIDRAKELKGKCGPILYQFPPHWKVNKERLEQFLDQLPGRYSHVLEFRDESWFDEEVYELMRRHRVGLCLHDFPGGRWPEGVVTANIVYFRRHGATGKYQGNYPRSTLRELARRIQDLVDDGREVYCYFNNDEKAYATENAQQLREMLQ